MLMEKHDLKYYIGLQIKTAREGAGWTQEELAAKVGKAPETISNIERGFTSPSLQTLEILASAMNKDLVTFMPSAQDREIQLHKHKHVTNLISIAQKLERTELNLLIRVAKAFLSSENPKS